MAWGWRRATARTETEQLRALLATWCPTAEERNSEMKPPWLTMSTRRCEADLRT